MNKVISFLTRTRYPGRIHITDILAWCWLLFGVIMVVVPVAWAFMSSFKTEAEINRFPPSLIPEAAQTVQVEGFKKPLEIWQLTEEDGSVKEMAMVRRLGRMAQMVDPANPTERINVSTDQLQQVRGVHFEVDNYLTPLKKFNFMTYFKNTFIVTFVTTILTLLICSMIAFALSKYEFKGRNAVLVCILSTMMIPSSVTMIPTYVQVYTLGLTDSLTGLILTSLGSTTGIFLLRQYMLTIPDELIEAARVDSASEFRIYWKIILPLSAPALAVLAIFSVMWRWNDFLWPLLLISSPENYTLQIGLNAFKGEFSVQWHYILAMTMLSLAPITAVFVVLQKHITSGIANTGIK